MSSRSPRSSKNTTRKNHNPFSNLISSFRNLPGFGTSKRNKTVKVVAPSDIELQQPQPKLTPRRAIAMLESDATKMSELGQNNSELIRRLEADREQNQEQINEEMRKRPPLRDIVKLEHLRKVRDDIKAEKAEIKKDRRNVGSLKRMETRGANTLKRELEHAKSARKRIKDWFAMTRKRTGGKRKRRKYKKRH